MPTNVNRAGAATPTARPTGFQNINNNPVSSGPLAPSVDFVRHPAVSGAVRELATNARENGYASYGEIYLPAGFDVDHYNHAYGTGQAKEINVRRAPADGMFRATLVMSVSGHTGQADQFAKSNQYTITVRHPDGTTQTMSPIDRINKNQAEYATPQDFEFKLQKGKTQIRMTPVGTSAGGYTEGRVFNVNYGDQLFKPIKPTDADQKQIDISWRAEEFLDEFLRTYNADPDSDFEYLEEVMFEVYETQGLEVIDKMINKLVEQVDATGFVSLDDDDKRLLWPEYNPNHTYRHSFEGH